MGAQILSLLRFATPLRDWSQQELAEFYRVESALIRSGMRIETERGVTDDGDPWFAFCRAEDGEVFIHFARIDGEYLIAGPGYEGIARGRDFASLVKDLISRHPLVQPGAARSSGNVFLHPAALLIAVVATAFFKTGEAKAEDGEGRQERQRGPATATASGQGSSVIYVDADQTLTVIASAMIALDREGSLLSAASVRAFNAQAHTPRADLFQSADVPAMAPAPALLEVGGAASRASTLLKDVGAWLALTVVLQDLAAGGGTTSATTAPGLAPILPIDRAGPLVPLAETATSAASPELAAPAPQRMQPVFAVELTAGPLPDVEAIRVIQNGGLVDTGTIIQVAKLPAMLIDFIGRGDHLSEEQLLAGDLSVQPNPALPGAGATDQPDLAAPDADAPALPPVDISTAPPAEVPVADASTLVPAPPIPAAPDLSVPGPPEFVPPPAAVPSAPSTAARDAAVSEAIAHFYSHTAVVEVMMKDNEVVFYDTRIALDPSRMGEIDSMTFKFADGSSISLVGAASALPDLHGLH